DATAASRSRALSLHDALPICRTQFIAFSGVVVDDVEDYFQIGIMQVRDHLLEFADLAAGKVFGMRREKRNAVVAPVIAHAFFQRSEEHTSELQSRENLVCRLL